jgi:predicted DNA-binding protein YlxM (UPF0122 family)
MKTKKIDGIHFKDLGNKPFPIETPPQHIRLQCVLLCIAKPKSGKTFFISNLLDMLPFDRIVIVSSTFNSNKKMMEHLKIDDNDVIDPNDPDAVQKIYDIVNGERDDLLQYREKLKLYKQFEKLLADNQNVPDELLEMFYNGYDFEKPTHKWNGRKPNIAVFLDDVQNSSILSPKLSNMVIKYRHLGSFEDGSRPIGISIFMALQNYTSQGNGLPKSIRGQATHLAVWKTGNKKELDLLATEQSGQLEPEKFYEAYNFVMNNPNASPHDFLFCDLAAKEGHSQFRKNYNEMIVL